MRAELSSTAMGEAMTWVIAKNAKETSPKIEAFMIICVRDWRLKIPEFKRLVVGLLISVDPKRSE
jgi:hypothetical protein